MLLWLKAIFGMKPEEQLAEIERHEPSLEERLDCLVTRISGYKHKDSRELDEIIEDLNKVLDILEKIITTLENIGGQTRAAELRRRLRNNRTRALNARNALRA